MQVESYQVPVDIAGVRIEPGDYLRGDRDGVIAIPAARIGEVLDAAEQIRDAEERIREQIAGGASLREAREQARYHQLQTPDLLPDPQAELAREHRPAELRGGPLGARPNGVPGIIVSDRSRNGQTRSRPALTRNRDG